MPLIAVHNLVKDFGGQRILNGINLTVHEGDLKVVMGPSGCGKSAALPEPPG